MTSEAATETAAHEEHHPSPGEYVKVALVLAVVTLAEVALFYVAGIPDGLLAAALLILMAIKFALVALWFMHLRFDNVMFRRLFITGIVLALAIYTVVLVSFGLLIGA